MQVDVPSQHNEDTLYSLLVWYWETDAYDIYIAAYVSGNTFLKVRLFININVGYPYNLSWIKQSYEI